MATEIATIPTAAISRYEEDREMEQSRFMPVMSIETAVLRRNTIVVAVKKLMQDGQDFGTIPGTPKPTLYQPGADKLNNLFGLVPRFIVAEKHEDWTGERHGGEPFFAYTVTCQLTRSGVLMGEGAGSCNSWESKYRYRKSERVCPSCGKDSIIKGKPEYGGGWICFAKKGGCNAKFKTGDPSIEGQATGRVANPDIFDMVNTVLKMANKRAKIAATLNATSAHEFFTQDIEDLPTFQHEEPPPPAPTQSQVAESKIQQMKAGAPYAETKAPLPIPVAEQVPEEVTAMWAEMKNITTVCNVFSRLRSRLVDATGNEEAYYQILMEHGGGAKHANELKQKGARQACWRMYDAIIKAEAALEPQGTDEMPEFDGDPMNIGGGR